MDFMGMMKQATELKSKMEAMQAELDQIEVEGAAGGGMVTVRLTAKGELKSVTIDPSLMKPDEKEIVEDLVVTAHAEARRKAETLLQDKMKTSDRRPAAAAGPEAVLNVVASTRVDSLPLLQGEGGEPPEPPPRIRDSDGCHCRS